jgi:Asp/Glu/hydantoin racemase
MKPLGLPVIQIDEAMMEQAVSTEGKILVVATHGPTVKSTESLLRETAERMGKKVDFAGATVEEAFELLGQGSIAEHNQAIAQTIRGIRSRDEIDVVVLAQLSMSVFSFSFPDPVKEFGIPVLNSGQTGFARAGDILRQK